VACATDVVDAGERATAGHGARAAAPAKQSAMTPRIPAGQDRSLRQVFSICGITDHNMEQIEQQSET
jgi:hypothetical protein